MENNQNDKVFRYTYTGKTSNGMTYQDCEMIKKIRSKYIEDKMDKLNRLDNEVTKKGKAMSFNIGLIGAIIFGIAICASILEKLNFLPGALIGVIGIILMIFAFPMKKRIIEKEREKIAPEILRLADEIIGENNKIATDN